jgi:hypothetical protein
MSRSMCICIIYSIMVMSLCLGGWCHSGVVTVSEPSLITLQLLRLSKMLVMVYVTLFHSFIATSSSFLLLITYIHRCINQCTQTLAAVDCTIHKAICGKQGIKGYPTIKYLRYQDVCFIVTPTQTVFLARAH